MKLLLESEKHALTPQKKQEAAHQMMDSTLFETKHNDGYLDLQKFSTKIMFLLDDVELLDPHHTIASEKLWNHVTLEVQAGMAENISLSLATRHVLQHDLSLQEEHKTREFLKKMVGQMSRSYHALQEALRHRENLLRKSGRSEDTLQAFVSDVGEKTKVPGQKPADGHQARQEKKGICFDFNSPKGCSRPHGACRFSHEKQKPHEKEKYKLEWRVSSLLPLFRTRFSLRRKASCSA